MKSHLNIIVTHVFCVEPEGGGDGSGDPVDHDVGQKFVQAELLRQVAVGGISVCPIRPFRKKINKISYDSAKAHGMALDDLSYKLNFFSQT
jgi:hypothetical protein